MPHIPAISSMSLGRACVHDFETKMDALRSFGFATVELFFEDLEVYANTHYSEKDSHSRLYCAASKIEQICTTRNIRIICLQPFMHYEGLRDRVEHAAAIANMKLWIELAHLLKTDLISIPSSFLPEDEISGDMDLIVSDLREVAGLGAQARPPIRFAYEALAWGTYVDEWEQAWDIVQRVGMPNFGLCLDTFNIAARVYADPALPSGIRSHADKAVQESVSRLVSTVDRSKVFYVQVVDAEKLDRPLIDGHEFHHPQQPARMSWSRNCRLFYGEKDEGAYLPIREIANAIFNGLRFEGWVSMELFNRCMSDPNPETPRILACRAAHSWNLLKRDLKLREGKQDEIREERNAQL